MSPASTSPTTNGFQFTKSTVLGPGGEELTTLDGSNTWLRTNVYVGGRLMATYDQAGLHFHLSDPLGTRRVQLSGNLTSSDLTLPLGQAELDCQSLPFGDQQSCVPAPNAPPTSDDATPLHFTGKERDTESGNDYIGARYYSSNDARFLTPDPLGPWMVDVSDPQSWNMYVYGRNNPLINIDPLGYDCVYLNDAGTGVESVDKHSNSGECGNHGGYWGDGTFTSGTVYSNSNDVYLNGTENGQLTNAYYNVVSANGSSNSPDTTDVFSGPNLFAYDPTKPLPSSFRNNLVHSLNRSGQSDALINCIISRESSGISGAASNTSSARGLMQILRGGANDVAAHSSPSDFGGMSGPEIYSQLGDPAISIAAGSAFVHLKIGYAHGNVQKGLDMYGTGAPYGQEVLGCAGH